MKQHLPQPPWATRQEIETILSVSRRPRWPRQVRKAISRAFSRTNLANVNHPQVHLHYGDCRSKLACFKKRKNIFCSLKRAIYAVAVNSTPLCCANRPASIPKKLKIFTSNKHSSLFVLSANVPNKLYRPKPQSSIIILKPKQRPCRVV